MKNVENMIYDLTSFLSEYPVGYTFDDDELTKIASKCDDIINMIEISP